MRRDHISSSNGTNTSVSSKDNNRSKSWLKSSVEESKAFNIKHVHLIDEKDSWNKFSNSLINISINNFINFSS